jgi:hypothetical protein
LLGAWFSTSNLIRNLRRVTDPLLRHAGIDLDEQ